MSKKKTPKNYIGRFDQKELRYLKHDSKPYTVISLFSGAGGFDVGTSQAGFQTRVMVEWERAACRTLEINFTLEGHKSACSKRGHKGCLRSMTWYHEPEPAIMCEDITKLSTERILEAGKLRVGECTLLTGGFPCQGFSAANGKKKDRWDDDKRNLLYLECVRVIKEALPKTFCLENVPGLVSMDKGAVVRMICNDLAAVGYNVTWYKLNAADYGVPQNRVRIFFFGRRNDVMVLNGKTPQLHIGGAAGPIKHPDWFIEKYGNVDMSGIAPESGKSQRNNSTRHSRLGTGKQG